VALSERKQRLAHPRTSAEACPGTLGSVRRTICLRSAQLELGGRGTSTTSAVGRIGASSGSWSVGQTCPIRGRGGRRVEATRSEVIQSPVRDRPFPERDLHPATNPDSIGRHGQDEGHMQGDRRSGPDALGPRRSLPGKVAKGDWRRDVGENVELAGKTARVDAPPFSRYGLPVCVTRRHELKRFSPRFKPASSHGRCCYGRGLSVRRHGAIDGGTKIAWRGWPGRVEGEERYGTQTGRSGGKGFAWGRPGQQGRTSSARGRGPSRTGRSFAGPQCSNPGDKGSGARVGRCGDSTIPPQGYGRFLPFS